MKVYMYHFQPFDLEVRESFDLQAWPHTDDKEHRKLFDDYMKSLTVFRYQNSQIEGYPDRIDHHINYEITNRPDGPFTAYRSVCVVDNEDLVVRDWVKMPEGEAIWNKAKAHPIASDMKAWDEWNIPGTVKLWNGSIIQFERNSEYIDSLCGRKKCDKSVKYMSKEERMIQVKK